MDHYEKAKELLAEAEKVTFSPEQCNNYIRLAEIHLQIWRQQQMRNQPPGFQTWNQPRASFGDSEGSP